MYTAEVDLRVPIPGIAPQLGINGRFFGIAGAVTELDENGAVSYTHLTLPTNREV
mgnify:CR=1 FL=1